MYILDKKYYKIFSEKVRRKKNAKNSNAIFSLVKNRVNFLKVNFGEFLIFDQTIPHGNIINNENETRWSMNCRFKSLFSPYGDKRIGEFFTPITVKPMTKIGLNYKFPFKK